MDPRDELTAALDDLVQRNARGEDVVSDADNTIMWLIELREKALACERPEAPITVYRFHEAPRYLRELSQHGGDEDWLAEVPPQYDWIGWMDEGTAFGCCSVSIQDHPTREGWKVHIGTHS